jgi:hypothetical protein
MELKEKSETTPHPIKHLTSKPTKTQTQTQSIAKSGTKRAASGSGHDSKCAKKVTLTASCGGVVDDYENDVEEEDMKLTREDSNNGGSSKNESGKVDDTNVILRGLVEYNDDMGLNALDKDAVKRALELMEESKRVALEERWHKFNIAKMELFVKRTRLIRDQARLVLKETEKRLNL